MAQEQLAEYASEKSAAATAILQQAEQVEATLGQLLQAGGGDVSTAAAALQQLKTRLAEAALEAQAFSEQQQADVERLKRSSRQVCLWGGACVVWHVVLHLAVVVLVWGVGRLSPQPYEL